MPEPEPGGLDQGIASQAVAGLGDSLAASSIAAVIGAGGKADIACDLSSIGEPPVIDFPGENGGDCRANAVQT